MFIKSFKKVKAQAMHFAVLVAAIIALLLSAFLLMTHTHRFFQIKSENLIKQIDTTNSILLNFINNVGSAQDTLIVDNNQFLFKKHISYFGAWKKVYVSSKMYNKTVEKLAFYGGEYTDQSPNLYLKNTNSPLIVVGDAKIEGNNYFPKEGIRAGIIAGNYYQGRNLYLGKAKVSAESLPELANDWLQYIKELQGNQWLSDKELVSLENEVEIKQSFYKKTKIIYSPFPIDLNEHQLYGNIIIKSDSRVRIGRRAKLTDVLLIAPEISIDSNFEGSLQAVASKKISIGKKVHLKYPSSLIMDYKEPTKKGNNNSFSEPIIPIKINKNVLIEGSVVFVKKENKEQRGIEKHIDLSPKSTIIGELYCKGNVELQGTVKGSLYTHQLLALQYGSVYINHIYNGKVIKHEIPAYSGLPFKNNTYTLAKWLY